MTSNVNEKVSQQKLSKVVGPFFLTPGALNHPVISVDSHDNVDAGSRVQATAVETKPQKIKRAKKSAKIQHVPENLVPENVSKPV